MKKNSKTAAYYSRFEASMILNELYIEFLKDNKLIDTERPDWYSILSENTRSPLALSAIKQGYPKGNRGAYTQLNFVRLLGKTYYFRVDLIKWFEAHFEYRILARAAA